jgi:hypothetical protein
MGRTHRHSYPVAHRANHDLRPPSSREAHRANRDHRLPSSRVAHPSSLAARRANHDRRLPSSRVAHPSFLAAHRESPRRPHRHESPRRPHGNHRRWVPPGAVPWRAIPSTGDWPKPATEAHGREICERVAGSSDKSSIQTGKCQEVAERQNNGIGSVHADALQCTIRRAYEPSWKGKCFAKYPSRPPR